MIEALLSNTDRDKIAQTLTAMFPNAVVFMVDKDRKLRFWKDATEHRLGYKPEKLIGEICLAGNRCVQCMGGCGLTQKGSVDHVPITLFCEDGSTRAYKKHAVAFRDQNGEFDGGIEILLPDQHPEKTVTQSSVQTDERFGLISRDPDMFHVFDMIEKVAKTDIPVLVRGESGTGKELVARAIHHQSPRSDKPFIAINCASLNESMLESELFGHVKGAFTGAIRDHIGVFERARGGTLFLDEIAEIPIELQAKLLRVLESGEYTPLGGETVRNADARIITATHRALREEAKSGRFREDLLYRLRVVPIFLPNLKSRPGDIPLLINDILKNYFLNKPIPKLEKEALNALMRHDWPGNIRELKNVVHYACVMSDNNVIKLTDLPQDISLGKIDKTTQDDGKAFDKNLKIITPERVSKAMHMANGNLNTAAEILNISRTSLWRYRKKFGLEKE